MVVDFYIVVVVDQILSQIFYFLNILNIIKVS